MTETVYGYADTRPPFNPYACCKKCGASSALIATRHTRMMFEPPYEVIRRTCGRCGYVWDELPVDAVSRR